MRGALGRPCPRPLWSAGSADNDRGARVANRRLAVRLLTVAVVAPGLLGTLFFAPPLAWYGIVFVASLIGASELFGMTHPNDAVSRVLGVVMTGGVSLVMYFHGDDPRALLTLVA